MKKKTICFVLALVMCMGLAVPLGVAAAAVPIIPSITIRPFSDSDFTITMTNVYDIFSFQLDWDGGDMPAFYLDVSGTVSFNKNTMIQTSVVTPQPDNTQLIRRLNNAFGTYEWSITFPDGSYRFGNLQPFANAGVPIHTDDNRLFWGGDAEWRDLSIISYNGNFHYWVDDGSEWGFSRYISFVDIRSDAQRNILAGRYARIDTHGPSNEGRRLSLSGQAGFWEIVDIRGSVPPPTQHLTPIIGNTAPDITAFPTPSFSLTLLHAPADTAGFTDMDVFVSAPDGRTLGGMFLVMQISEPGSRASPNIVQFELWDRQFAEVPIGLVRNGTNINILLVEGTSFFDPNMIIHASVNN